MATKFPRTIEKVLNMHALRYDPRNLRKHKRNRRYLRESLFPSEEVSDANIFERSIFERFR